MATRVPMSTPAVGSQSTSSAGSRARQRATTTFCWLPPLSVEIGAPGPAVTTPRRCVQRSTSCASARWSSRPRRPRPPRTDSDRFSLTANSAMIPSRPRSAGTRGMSRSRASAASVHSLARSGSRRRPLTGCAAQPAITYGSSRTPAPARPAMPTISPRWTSRSTPRSQRPWRSRASSTTGASGRAATGAR